MKSIVKHMIIFMLLGQFLCPSSGAQNIQHPDPVERVSLFTDRSVYIAGEEICFSACVVLNGSSMDGDLSRLLYLEIIDRNGNQVLGKKFRVSEFICTGVFPLPPELSTGTYYIRGYTKYMRNSGPVSFDYNQITVINPYMEDVPFEGTELKGRQAGYTIKSPYNDQDIFDIQTDKQAYGRRDSVRMEMRPRIHPDSLRSVCISVVPSHSASYKTLSFFNADTPGNDFNYKPEYHGITLSGLVIDKNSSRPLPKKILDLTILGENGDFISVYADSSGRFLFPLPGFTGQHNVYIGTRETDTAMPSILIDNDFCTQPVSIPGQSFMLTEDERITALNLARNFQISRRFRDSIPEGIPGGDKDYHDPFYGIPTETLKFDDYIQLPTVEDYFNELPYLVKVRKTEGRKHFKILGSSPELSIFQPLVLLDMVAVYEIDKILAISSMDISHIDVINEPYIKGVMTYGGIVSIFSKNNDFAGIGLPRSGIFINYDFLSPSGSFDRGPADPGIPDARNTLFWDGNFRATGNLQEEISFTTGDSPGGYEIVVRGVLHNGNSFIQKLAFRVE